MTWLTNIWNAIRGRHVCKFGKWSEPKTYRVLTSLSFMGTPVGTPTERKLDFQFRTCQECGIVEERQVSQ